MFRTFAFPWGKVPNGCETDEGRRCCSMSAVVGACEHRFPSSVALSRTSGLACRLGRRFCLRQRYPADTRGLACRLGRRFCLRQRCPPDTRAPREAIFFFSRGYQADEESALTAYYGTPKKASDGYGGTMWASSPTKSECVEPMLDTNAFPRGKVAERSEVG